MKVLIIAPTQEIGVEIKENIRYSNMFESAPNIHIQLTTARLNNLYGSRFDICFVKDESHLTKELELWINRSQSRMKIHTINELEY